MTPSREDLRPALLSFQFWFIVVPGTGLAAAVLSVLSFAVWPPFDGWTP